ncbi:MAG: DUF421 domain-containing protein [Gemmatimonadaceae bacterium]|nr:DUF421 domain-containing protein [Gemmatimonadaceae bacterium]
MLGADITLVEKVVRTVAVYLALVVGLRVFGKRELGQLNPFDLVVLLLLSNTLQNAVIGADDSLEGGLFGALVLLVMNAIVVRLAYRYPRIGRLLEGRSELLVRDGQIVHAALVHNRITLAELEAAARREGFDALHEVESARLEVSGAVSFVRRVPDADAQRHAELVARLDDLSHRISRLAPPR